MPTSPRHGLQKWSAGFKQSDTILNADIDIIDVRLSLGVRSRTETAPLGGDAAGHCYIIPASPTGAFSGFTENNIAWYDGTTWYEFTPVQGQTAYVNDDTAWVGYNGSAWAGITGSSEFVDNVFRIVDNGDGTKKVAFEASGITTGTVRTITMPDADVTLGELEGTAVKSTGEAGGTKFLREDGDGTCSWQEVSTGSVEGTAVLSTGPVTDGHVLTADGAGGAAWEAPSGGSGAMTLLGTATVSGSAATTLTVSGLDLSAYKAFRIIAKVKNAIAGSNSVRLFYNADTTTTNYDAQLLQAISTGVNGAHYDEARIQSLDASENLIFTVDIIADVDGYPRAVSEGNNASAANLILRKFIHHWTSNANVTSITLSSATASGLAIGSTFTVYGIS